MTHCPQPVRLRLRVLFLYVYCRDGFRMGLAYLQLKHLGYRDVRPL